MLFCHGPVGLHALVSPRIEVLQQLRQKMTNFAIGTQARLRAAVLAGCLMATGAIAQPCPPVLEEALTLVLVTTASMDTPAGRMRIYRRATRAEVWTGPGDGAENVVVGQAGLAWGLGFAEFRQAGEREKAEGDRRTPAGFYGIGGSFGFEPSAGLELLLEPGKTVCVDDIRSPHYNSISTRQKIGPAVSAENMRAIPLYRHGLFVDYNTERQRGRGSCIFIHIWKGPGSGTAGCIAMPEARVKALQGEARPAVLGVWPARQLSRIAGCLPGIDVAKIAP